MKINLAYLLLIWDKNKNMKHLLLILCSVLNLVISAQTPVKEAKIGTQIWTSTNLNTAKFRNGELIPQAKTAEEWKKAGEEGKPIWAFYNFSPENGKKYGRLYNWYAVNDKRGLAPIGYKVPTDSEWKILVDYCGGIMEAGKKLKSAAGWKDKGNGSSPNGFNGLPGGFVLANGTFGGLETSGGWWTSTEGTGVEYENSAWDRYLDAEKNTVETYAEPWVLGFSVRCIKIKK
jgi:uncharacterized protein (TIGR02145 family)